MAEASSSFISRFNACESPKEVLKHAEPLGASGAAAELYAAHGVVNVELLGACLGNHTPFFKELVLQYPTHFAFTGVGIVDALRRYLYQFRLPGESAQIERILEGFARAFFVANPPAKKPSSGWYIRQPPGERCCIHCGATEDRGHGVKGWLNTCQGCQCVTFCKVCRKNPRVSHGHAIGGMMGYGRACVAARRAGGLLTDGGDFTYTDAYGARVSVSVWLGDEAHAWERVSPFRTEDSVMVLCYAIIMLTTNLHSDKVKQKMKKHEFLWQNKGVNDNGNFPGDFLSDVYDDIKNQELEVVKPV